MKIQLFFVFFSVFSASLWAQEEYPVIDFENQTSSDLKELGLTPEDIKKMSDESFNHLKNSVVEMKPLNINELELIGFEVILPKTSLFPPSKEAQFAKSALLNLEQAPLISGNLNHCLTPKTVSGPALSLSTSVSDVLGKIDDQHKKEKRFNPGMIYFTWGYNRGFHSKSDATFKTKDGTFTIKDAVGHDRPSTELLDYIHPARIPIPQYNVRLGYQLNPNWSIEAGMDHMKWVFDPSLQYEVEGDYNRQVFVPHPTDPAQLNGLNFSQVKETGDMRWLTFEHTDGYNYAFLGSVYKHNLFQSKNENFKIDALAGAGLGLMIPKTKVMFHQDGWWNWEGLDNRFKIAGYGVHAEGKLRMTYKKFFMEAAGRGTYIKVKNALVNDQKARLKHTPIASFQFIVQGGVQIPLSKKKTKK